MSNSNPLMSKIESLLFVIGEDGLTVEQLTQFTESTEQEVVEAIQQLVNHYELDVTRGITLKEIAGTYQLISKPENAPFIEKLVENPPPQTLSQAALEVLAIVAYKQPIPRVEIEDLRGVKCERALHTLGQKALIQEVGRVEGSGRAILYGTTKEFLNYFGLKDLEELPPLESSDEVMIEDGQDLFMSKFQEAFSGDSNS
ncbi:segregation and condensation protein B [Kurthia zopfii]|uniref:Segregation and condensation protein B n=1 Tax=Kurthia zopfii TaxID=1650 RepID=A0A2U3AG68_9BACL|nr:SMC-Scp complex subunit ScpB [Kurthia zopfii]PWI23441.1 SMC-Scp complex subunit ScpB [Kurthia zopfii]TDR39823.1 segregation and condensation protein B [Kurthia zopfii]STX09272.1 Segregation and condensation protein B [Kurthia zopfii]VEI06207.1 Segregation and condensation protein B [Kurthia zopfii]GEK30711.1 segregation and condensation protein B [Kurthia zopfii]